MKSRTVEVVPYCEQWQHTFALERQFLSQAIDDEAIKIHHIGSTAIPRLAAKPIIDILMEVPNQDLLVAKSVNIEALGYVAKGENGIAGRRYFQKGGNNCSHHLHVYVKGDSNIKRHLAFRDYLRASPEIAQIYGQIKMAAASWCNNDIQSYMAEKNDFIQYHQKLAIAWQKTRLVFG